jgi:cytochrome c oxidase assembly protein subunit 15
LKNRGGSFFKVSINAPTKTNPWLFRFAVLTAGTTFLLIGLGGLVTSHEAGMSVPDWPTSYGYNMFALPIKFWKGGAFFEHTHRLLATFLGVLVVVLTRWLGGRASRFPLAIIGAVEIILGVLILSFFQNIEGLGHFFIGIGAVVLLFAFVWVCNQPASPLLVQCGWWAFMLVQLQGFLGGLRVTMKMDSLGIFHGAVAQTFFVLVCAIALFTSRFWIELAARQKELPVPCGLRHHVLFVTILIFAQLLIGATMRHQHAGLAIPDFPSAYGKIWPDTGAAAIARYNAERVEVTNVNPITAFQVVLQMIHRLAAFLILAGVAAAAWLARKRLGGKDPLTKLAIFWLALIVFQIGLGMATIWTNKAADVATAHVMVGALSLVTGALWCLIGFGRAASPLPDAQTFGVFGVQTSMMANK